MSRQLRNLGLKFGGHRTCVAPAAAHLAKVCGFPWIERAVLVAFRVIEQILDFWIEDLIVHHGAERRHHFRARRRAPCRHHCPALPEKRLLGGVKVSRPFEDRA
jgi:hypothetical protein